MINEGKNDYSKYIENRIDIGLFFFFVACAGVSIIVWAFNWICWLNQCCGCDFLHNPVNKRIAWWTSFAFLLGMLAFCISAFVSVNRFGFALEGAWCSLDRIYYDFKNGQLKESYPKWIGIEKLNKMIDDFKDIIAGLSKMDDIPKLTTIDEVENPDEIEGSERERYITINNDNYEYISRYKKIYYYYQVLKETQIDNS